MIKVKENDFKKNQNIYSVKEEKNTSVKIWKKKFFEQDCEVRLSKAYWGQKKIWLHFLFSYCDLTEKKLRLILKSVARIFQIITPPMRLHLIGLFSYFLTLKV